MKVYVMVGGPGAGKGTQASLLAQKLGLAHVASGDLFRDNIKRDTTLGRKVKQYLERGALVPDDVTVQMIDDRRASPGGRRSSARSRRRARARRARGTA